MDTQAVIGIGFGDEGKGMAVSYLCSQSYNPLVIRYSGGQQAGHHVVINDALEHVFSNFGSGTLQGFDTYWSEYCTVDPIGILNELHLLKSKGVDPTLFINSKSPVTTPYDILYNRTIKKFSKNGSCGVGVGQTYQREEDFYSLTFSDLFYPSVLKIKLNLIKDYYSVNISEIPSQIEFFIEASTFLTELSNIVVVNEMPHECHDKYIFEGSQGLLLDQNIGFFPHVTRGNTGSKNIIKMGFKPHIYLVTRAYQTRHGIGAMTNEGVLHNIEANPYEQNTDYNFQGKFRKSMLDLDLLKYAINKDDYIRETKDKSLIVTCLDLFEDDFLLTINGELHSYLKEYDFINKIRMHLGINDIYLSRSPKPELERFDVQTYKQSC